MYAVIEAGGFQHKVQLGEILRIPTVDGEVGSEIEYKSVLLYTNGTEVKIGTPLVEDSAVKAEILSHGKDKKVEIFKMKRRTGYRLHQGHRQGFTEVVITEIKSGSEVNVTDKKVVERAQARAKALFAQKAQGKKLTRADKIAAGMAPTNNAKRRREAKKVG